MLDVVFVLPGLIQSGGVRAVFEVADNLRLQGRTTAIVVPRRSILSPGRSIAGVAERVVPQGLLPHVQRTARRKPVSQSWFPLQTPLIPARAPLWKDIPAARAVVATSWRTAEEVLRAPWAAERGVYFLQHHETWSGPEARIDATWRAFDRMVVSSEWLREIAHARFGKTGVGLAVYGVDLEVFRPLPSSEPRSVAVIGFMHDDRDWKGGADMLRALETVRGRRDVRVKAFGLGMEPLPDWVEFEGRLTGEALADFYRSLDVFASASWTETGPMTVPEAMACAVSVVTTDVGNVRLWSHDGTTVRMVPPRDPAALTAALDHLATDPSQRSRLAEAGRASIQPFTWSRMAADMDAALVGFGLLPKEADAR